MIEEERESLNAVRRFSSSSSMRIEEFFIAFSCLAAMSESIIAFIGTHSLLAYVEGRAYLKLPKPNFVFGI